MYTISVHYAQRYIYIFTEKSPTKGHTFDMHTPWIFFKGNLFM